MHEKQSFFQVDIFLPFVENVLCTEGGEGCVFTEGQRTMIDARSKNVSGL